MWSTPRSIARRSTARAASGSRGGPMTPGPASCMAPNPMRRIGLSPRKVVAVMAHSLPARRCVDARARAPCSLSRQMLGVAKLAAGPGHIDLVQREPADVPTGCVRLAVRAAGICGTDLHIEAGEYPSVPPVTMGHEVCGAVVETGAGVDAAWDGARVVSETYFSTCGRCRHCRAGRPNLCPDRRSIGTHVDGAFAESVVVPAHGLHRVPEALADAAAALCEPLACVCQSLLDPPAIVPGDRVLVVGPGAIGLLAAQVAAAGGAEVEVRGTAQDGPRLSLARDLGCATSVAGA